MFTCLCWTKSEGCCLHNRQYAKLHCCTCPHADVLPAGTNPKNQYTRSVDIFAFGLCVLELATKQRLDSHNAAVWPELLDTVQDDETRNFIHRCIQLLLVAQRSVGCTVQSATDLLRLGSALFLVCPECRSLSLKGSCKHCDMRKMQAKC